MGAADQRQFQTLVTLAWHWGQWFQGESALSSMARGGRGRDEGHAEWGAGSLPCDSIEAPGARPRCWTRGSDLRLAENLVVDTPHEAVGRRMRVWLLSQNTDLPCFTAVALKREGARFTSSRIPAGRQSGRELCGVIRQSPGFLSLLCRLRGLGLTALGEAGPPPPSHIPTLKVPSSGHSAWLSWRAVRQLRHRRRECRTAEAGDTGANSCFGRSLQT